MQISDELIQKYNVPVPRYTSYPTVPFWDNDPMDKQDWFRHVQREFNQSNQTDGISLYIHLPYCESLCTYCACNTRITKNHKVEEKYIQAVLAEWKTYCTQFSSTPIIRELHLGGGTPTFFSPKNLTMLIDGIFSLAKKHDDHEFSFEGHPNNTTFEHLHTLYQLGFRRVSYGIQDLDVKVQKTINRVQPIENVIRATEDARTLGYTSVNYDLIYGLPFQTEETITDTINQVVGLQPDRIAFYSYAHVPWKRPGQRAYSEEHLPDDAAKRNLYEKGKDLLTAHGYLNIGMDHFALKNDSLHKAYQIKNMHRNFMGYTTNPGKLLIGLGASSISDCHYAYAQNHKHVEKYMEEVLAGKSAYASGHVLTEEDLKIKQYILGIACKGEANWANDNELLDLDMIIQLNQMHEEGLIRLFNTGLRITDLGMVFLRNICSVFDKRMAQRKSEQKTGFSKAI